jgi:hypothetical protein
MLHLIISFPENNIAYWFIFQLCYYEVIIYIDPTIAHTLKYYQGRSLVYFT